MTDFLVKFFVKNYKHTELLSVRTSYGIFAGVVGILCNIFLFVIKFIIGTILHSISVTADAFNNLSDAGTSVIGLIGIKMAGKPADQDHPFGHGRIEYISALIVAFLIIQVGFSFFTESVKKIFNPEALSFQLISVIILALSIGIKLWLGAFNRKLGKRLDSKVMLAAAADALGDVITTSVTIISILIFHFAKLNVDGLVGSIVACVVVWAGISIAKDTLEPLIGTAADPEFCMQVTQMVESYEGIVGSHDLIIHNYGPGRSMASIHAEVPRDADMEETHEIIDRIERDVAKMLGLFLVIHTDPIETRDERILGVREDVNKVLDSIDERLSMHDFRLVEGKKRINLIFDLVIPYECTSEEQDQVYQIIIKKISGLDKRYQCVITIEKSFVATN